MRQVRSDIPSKLEEKAPKTDPTGVPQDGASLAENADGETLEDLVRTLHQQIQNSDWLKENTAEKWMEDNPEFAKAFLEQSAEK